MTGEVSNFFFMCDCFIGNAINVVTGEWTGEMSGLGAGLDSFYEYLLKVRTQLKMMIFSAN